MKNRKNIIFVVVGIVLAVFLSISFIIPFAKTGTFWTAFVFTIIAIISQIYIASKATEETPTPVSRLLGWPILQVGYVYLIVQGVLGIIFMATAFFMPIWIAAILQIIVLAVAGLSLIAAEVTRDFVSEQETEIVADTELICKLRANAKALAKLNQVVELQKDLDKISEELQYSDPVSSPSLAEIENILELKFAEIKSYVSEKTIENAKVACSELSEILVNRNEQCKVYKKQGVS